LPRLFSEHKAKIEAALLTESHYREYEDCTNEGVTYRGGCSKTGKTHLTDVEVRTRIKDTDYDGATMKQVMYKWVYTESFQSYDQQQYIHLSEYGGKNSLRLNAFKELVEVGKKGSDNYCTIPKKGKGASTINVKKIFMDSNAPMTSHYKTLFEERPDEWMPYVRRFQKIIWFPFIRLNPNPVSVTDYLLDTAGRYVSNQFDEVVNPNPSSYDITDNVQGTSYGVACDYFTTLMRAQSMVGQEPKTVVIFNTGEEVGWKKLKSHIKHWMYGKPLEICQAEAAMGATIEKDDPIIDVCVSRYLTLGRLPMLEYCSITRRWTALIDEDPERIRGGGAVTVPSDSTEDPDWGTGHGKDGATDDSMVCGVPNAASRIEWQ
jgi:hypothetical protein